MPCGLRSGRANLEDLYWAMSRLPQYGGPHTHKQGRALSKQCPLRHASVPVSWGAPLADAAGKEEVARASCCVPNPAAPASEGGECYWTALDPNMCS